MKALRMPSGAWPGHLATPVLALAPAALLLALAAATGAVDISPGAHGLLVGTATSAAALMLFVRWQITGTSGWPALLLAVAAVPELTLAAWSLAGHSTDRLEQAPSTVVVAVVVSTLAAIIAGTVLGLGEVDARIRTGLATGALCATAWCLTGPVALGLSLVAATLLVGSSAAVLHRALDDDKREVEELKRRLDGVEHGLREDRARLHEINSTVAGIASAQQLVQAGLSGDRGAALASMMQAEVQRLQRLVADRAPTRRRSVDLDDVVGQIVLSHLARGRVVLWEPTGLRALGRADDIAEVVNVLLENAAVHGGPDAVTVRVTRDLDGFGITVTVADQGPGIDAALHERIFDWAFSGPDSSGQGIGLHVAADISHQLGGRLELVPTQSGAVFALHLPAVPQEVSGDDHVVRAS